LPGETCRVSAPPEPSPAAFRSVPSGTITFAFTDIEGSTPRWERDRPAMQAAVRRHDHLIRAAIAEHGGYVFKTVGDAFCAAFARPADAVAAILAAQRGQTRRAIALVREILAMRSGMNARLESNLRSNLAGYLITVGDLFDAAEEARATLRLLAGSADESQVAISLEHLALVFALRGDLACAATLEGYSDATFVRYGSERETTERTTHDRLILVLQQQLAPNERKRLTAQGAALTSEAAIALALEEHESP
jgi:hypothetical protein